jgi:signal transduction histidine kinase/CheY-like chemotaxis protein
MAVFLAVNGQMKGHASPFIWVEAIATVLTVLGLHLLRERNREGAVVLTVGIGIVFFASLMHFGPLFGVGLMFVVWVLIVVFFHGRVLEPALGVAGMVLLVGAIESRQWLDLPFAPMTGGFSAWARMATTTAIMTWSVGYLFRELIDTLVEALHHEKEARERELTALAEREAAERAISRSQHLESVGKLAGGAAHDFNNSLTILVGGLETLRTGPLNAQQEVVLDEMTLAVQGALSTTRQLLSFSRQGTSPGSVVAPKESIETFLRSLRRLLPETIDIESHCEETPAVALPSGELQRALLNLCLNARDAMPSGGVLRVSCTHDPKAGEVEIVVADDGMGMDAETRAHVLEPFYTTKGESRGTGLGLAMVKESMVRVGGRIELDSQPQRGTRVRLRLPVAPVDAKPVEAELSHPVGSERARGRILLVEDDELVRRVTTRGLTMGGFQITAVDSVAAAIETFAPEDFDILVTDGILGDGAPVELIRLVQAAGKPVIVVSGYLRDQLLLGDVEQGTLDFLQKPVSFEDLHDTIHRRLGRVSSALEAG